MTFGEKLKYHREKIHLTTAEFAKKIGVSARTVHLYENGLRYPQTRKTYQRIAEELECDYNYLLDEEELFIKEGEKNMGLSEEMEIKELTDKIGILFSGKILSDQEKKDILKTIQISYWEPKFRNKKRRYKKRAK